MINISYIILFFIAVVGLQYLRFKLTRWKKIVELFESEKRSDLNPIYGYWSEFRQSPKSYPLSNTFLKLTPTNFGLYLQYDLKYEPIKFYKPVLIPWSNIFVSRTQESKNKGGEEYKILKNGIDLGIIFLQAPISEQIKRKTEELGLLINIG